MGNHNSTRWRGHAKKRTVEAARRISAREAQHAGSITTTATPVANSPARRLWALCPECGARVWYLYQAPDQAPDAEQWKCRVCHDLSYRSTQQRGTRAAFYEWLTMERWSEISQKHPATARLYERMNELWQENVAAFDWDRCSAARRAELLESYTGEAVVRRIFEHQRWKWSGEIEPLAQAAGEEIRADLWAWWKARNRSPQPEHRAQPATAGQQ